MGMTAGEASAGDGLDDLVCKMQAVIRKYIVPDSGITDTDCLNELIGLLDGPEQRVAQSHWQRVRQSRVQKGGECGCE